ncbi:hypothetical protein F901_01615 [Acinetobacter dispersus]|uniref:hypothetical protein n=1 Tax=Acinetobacter dispersus TaxID=70348 RepID=UPI0002CDB865|nr:hypothetical protein [Acinetobacter dispersus]ENX54316.1 hypothetical protein F901_01615 [Acinetobacter dispersus]
MNTNDQKLAHYIKIKFGTAPSQPNQHQLEQIKQDLLILLAKGINPSVNDWFKIVKKHCPDAGSYSYSGADNSDLTTLLQLATKK